MCVFSVAQPQDSILNLATMDNEQHQASEDFHVSAINIFPSELIQAKAEKEAARLFPRFKEVYKAIIIGPLESVPDPEVAVIIATPEQVHLMTRAYCYATGSFIQGFAGMGACRMLFPHAFLKKGTHLYGEWSIMAEGP